MPSLTPTVANIEGSKVIACPLNVQSDALSDEIKTVVSNASTRWLKNEEVLVLLESFQIDGIIWPKEAAERPDGKFYMY